MVEDRLIPDVNSLVMSHSAFFTCSDCRSDLFLLAPDDKQVMIVCRGCTNTYEILPSGVVILVRRGVYKLRNHSPLVRQRADNSATHF